MNTIWWFTFFYLVIRDAEPFQWAEVPRDGFIQYACAGETVHFPWSYTLSSGELLEDVQWFFQSQEGSSSSSSSSTISSSSGTISSSSSGMRMMAVMTNGAFLPVPSFSQRVVNHRNNAGITMDRVVTKDSGNYSVVISGRGSSGNFFQYHRSIGLQVGSDLMTNDGYLHVQESPVAVQDTVTKRWSLELQCGTFTYLGQPPFDVEWITPAMVILGSSRFEHGQFKLWLTQPVLGGSYTCRIPVHLTHTACLSGNATAKGQATFHLDATLARLTLLEAHQNALQKENDLLQNENAQLRAYALNLNDREIKLEALAYQRVIFHGHGLRNTHPAQGSALIVDNVVINQGQGYNGSTGTFTAPLNGTYFFIGTTGSWSSSQASQFSLIVDGQVIAFVSTRTQGPLEAVSVHGISHLRVGQQAWLGISYGVEFSSEVTSFSGYMISVDP